MKQLLTIAFVIATLTIACAQKNYVVLHGSAMDTTFKHVQIASPMLFPWSQTSQPVIVEQDKQADNSFELRFELTSPKMLYLQGSIGSWQIYCSPGDSVEFVMTKGPGTSSPDVTFYGRNASHYNYYKQAARLWMHFDSPRFRGDAKAYKDAVDTWHSRKEEQLDTYEKEFQVAPDFDVLARADMDYERAFLLYRPIRDKRMSAGDLSPEYFSTVKTINFNRPDLIEADFYRMALVMKQIYCSGDSLYGNDVNVRYKYLKSNFTGKTRDYLLASLIGLYSKNQGQVYRKELLSAITDARKIVKDKEYMDYINQSEIDYGLVNQSFSESLLASTHLVSYSDDKDLTLKDLLSQNKDKAIYFDFWASWCAPCRNDIGKSADAKKLLEKENVIYVYLSVDNDKDVTKWKAASEEDKTTENQYLLVGGMKSDFGRFLRLDYIPRYILLDKNHKIKKTTAPRPVPGQAAQLKASLAELKAKVYTYK